MEQTPEDVPDIHPNIAAIYKAKVTQLSEALADPELRDQAAEAFRVVVAAQPYPFRQGLADKTLIPEPAYAPLFYMNITIRVTFQYNSRCLIWSNSHDNRNRAPIWRGRNCDYS